MTNEEIDKWIETDSLCFEAAKRGATFAQMREDQLMLAFVTVHPQYKDAVLAYYKFADQCSIKK